MMLVTCGLPYANGPCHIGHLRTYVPADMFVRFLRKIGRDVVFVCGSDAHGTPITVDAERRGISPKELVDIYHRHYQHVFKRIFVEFDNYGNTDDPINHEMTREIVTKLVKKGLVYPREVRLPYCPKCKRPLPDRYVKGKCPYCGALARGDECDQGCRRYLMPGEIGDPHCAICGSPATMKSKRHHFFKLTAFTDFLKRYLKQLKGTSIARNYALQWIEGGLKDWTITRDLHWGVKFPGEEDLVTYVWVDAPIGYISSTRQWAEKRGGDWEAVWKGEAKIIHFIGADIIYHHCIFWPSMLKGVDFNLPWAVIASGTVMIEGKAFSKSRGYVVWVEDDYLKIGLDPDCLRYYVLSYTTHTRDLNFSWKDYGAKVNGELVATLGNFLHRTLSFAFRHWGKVPDGKVEKVVEKKISDTIKRVTDCVLNYEFKRAADLVVNLAGFGNKYLQKNEPWVVIKTDKDGCANTVYNCLRIAKAIAILMEPIMPKKAEQLWQQIGEKGDVHAASIDEARKSIDVHKIPKPAPLFDKIPSDKIDAIAKTIQKRIRSAGK